MLVVTFGRAASQELRERVRAQLVEAERALGDPALEAGDDEPLLQLLLDCPADERAAAPPPGGRGAGRRSTRATIATTHQFCSMVLGSLGVAGDTDARARLVEDLDDLVGEVVDDLYLRAFAYAEAEPAFSHDEAMAIARSAVGDPQARLEPSGRIPRDRPGAPGRASRTRCATSSIGASAGSASSPTTTCSASSPTRSSPRGRAGPEAGCGSAGRSCWSTSSKTPTRCSGRSSTGPSPVTRRWC